MSEKPISPPRERMIDDMAGSRGLLAITSVRPQGGAGHCLNGWSRAATCSVDGCLDELQCPGAATLCEQHLAELALVLTPEHRLDIHHAADYATGAPPAFGDIGWENPDPRRDILKLFAFGAGKGLGRPSVAAGSERSSAASRSFVRPIASPRDCGGRWRTSAGAARGGPHDLDRTQLAGACVRNSPRA
jgi:hypothetical protein